MLELNLVQPTTKPDRAADGRKADAVKGPDREPAKGFDDEYAAQSKPSEREPEAQRTDKTTEPSSKADAGAEDSAKAKTPDEPTEAAQPASEDPESTDLRPEEEILPDLAATPARKSKALSENAFGEQLALTQRAATPQDPNGTVAAGAEKPADGTLASKAPTTTAVTKSADMAGGPATALPKAPEKPLHAPTEAASPRVEGSNARPDKSAAVPSLASEAKTKPSLLHTATAPEQAARSAQSLLATDGSSRSDERRAHILAAKADHSAASTDTALRRTADATMPGVKTVQPSQAGPMMPSQADSFELSAISNSDLEAHTTFDTKQAQTSAANLQSILQRPETPGLIGRQIADAMRRMPDRPVELALNPEELGRVRMSLSASDTGITLTVLAERPETLDLMRRHIDQLAREFQALGYDSINFAFAEGQSDPNSDDAENGQEARGARTADGTELEDTDTPLRPITLTAATGLDMRL